MLRCLQPIILREGRIAAPGDDIDELEQGWTERYVEHLVQIKRAEVIAKTAAVPPVTKMAEAAPMRKTRA